MIGLNTRANRETTPGYRDNYVKCRCSEIKEKRVVNDLHDIGALNITVGRCIYFSPPLLYSLSQNFRFRQTLLLEYVNFWLWIKLVVSLQLCKYLV